MNEPPLNLPSSVVIVDRLPIVRDGLVGWFRCATTSIEVSTAASFQELSVAESRDPVRTVVIADPRGPNGIDFAGLVYAVSLADRTVVFTAGLTRAEGRQCRKLGVNAIVAKSEPARVVVRACGLASSELRIPELNSREIDVCSMWLRNGTKALAGEQLFITAATVSTHIARVRDKYAAVGRAANTKAALLARFIEDGFICPAVV